MTRRSFILSVLLSPFAAKVKPTPVAVVDCGTYALRRGEIVVSPQVMQQASIYLDGVKITRWIHDMSRSGKLKLKP